MCNTVLELLDQSKEDDVRFVFETRCHPKVVPYLFGKPPDSMEGHRQWLKDNVPSKRLLFVLKEEGKPVGYCQAYNYEDDTVEVGFVVHPDYQDRGYGGRMVDMLVTELGKRMPEKKVVLEVRADNDRAIGLYEWHGFVKTIIHMERR